MMKTRLVTALLITILGPSAIIVEARTSIFSTRYSLETLPHHITGLVDNHLVAGNLMLPLSNQAQSLWYAALESQILYQSSGSLVSLGSGYRSLLTSSLLYGGHAYLDIGQSLADANYYCKLNLGIEANYRTTLQGTINLYWPLQGQFTKPKTAYQFSEHKKIETCSLEENQKSVDTQFTLNRFNKIKPFLGFYYYQQQAQASLLGITVGTYLPLLSNLNVTAQYNFDNFHKHYIRLGLQFNHDHHKVRTKTMLRTLWQKPVRHIRPLDLQTTRATQEHYLFFKKQTNKAVEPTKATFEKPSPYLTQALVDQAPTNSILLIENPNDFIQSVDTLIQKIGMHAHVIFPENALQVVDKLASTKGLNAEKIALCGGTMEYIKITQPTDSKQKPIFLLSKFPCQDQEFNAFSNEAVSILLKSGQQLIGTTHHFSEKPRYPFERPAIRQVLNLSDNTQLKHINLYPLNQSSAHTVLDTNSDAISTNTGIIVQDKAHVKIKAVDLLGTTQYSYRTGIELDKSANSKLKNIHIRNAHTGMTLRKSVDTGIDNLTIGSVFKLRNATIDTPTIQSQYGMIIEDNSDNTTISNSTINSQDIGIDVKQSNIILDRSTLNIDHRYSALKLKAPKPNKRSTFTSMPGVAAIRIFNNKRVNANQIAVENRLQFTNNIINVHADYNHAYVTAFQIKGYPTSLETLQNNIQYFIDPKNILATPIPQYINNLQQFPLKRLTLVDNNYYIEGPKTCLERTEILENNAQQDWIVKNNTLQFSNNDSQLTSIQHALRNNNPFKRFKWPASKPEDTQSASSITSQKITSQKAPLAAPAQDASTKHVTPKYYIPQIASTLSKSQAPPISSEKDFSLDIDNPKLLAKINKAICNTRMQSSARVQLQSTWNTWINATLLTQELSKSNANQRPTHTHLQNYLDAVRKAQATLSPEDQAAFIQDLQEAFSTTDGKTRIAFLRKIYETIPEALQLPQQVIANSKKHIKSVPQLTISNPSHHKRGQSAQLGAVTNPLQTHSPNDRYPTHPGHKRSHTNYS